MNYRAAAFLGLLVLIAAAAAGGTYLMQPPLRPDPETAGREAIFEYLVVSDLATEPYEYQERMVNRVVAELATKPLSSKAGGQIPETYREQVEKNLLTLKHVWFRSRGLRYHKVPADERNAFLDQQIEAVLGWSRVDLQLNGNQADSPGEARAQYAAEFFDQVETWIAAAGADEAPLLSATVRDGIIRWLSTRNLEAEPMGTRQELAERIVAEFEDGLRLDEVLSTLNSHEQNHLSANSLLLIEAWLHQLAVEYEQLPAEQRDAFLRSRLDQVARWELAKLVRSTSSESASTGSPFSGLQASLRMFALINRWILRADEESRPRFEAFMMDLQRQWMSRQMGSSDGS